MRGGHSHDGAMGLYLDAFQSQLVTNWGYPLNWDSWYRAWVTHNTGRHYPFVGDDHLQAVAEKGRHGVMLMGVVSVIGLALYRSFVAGSAEHGETEEVA